MTPKESNDKDLVSLDISMCIESTLTQQCARLQGHTTRVNVLDQLTEDIRFELLNDQRLMLLTRGL